MFAIKEHPGRGKTIVKEGRFKSGTLAKIFRPCLANRSSKEIRRFAYCIGVFL